MAKLNLQDIHTEANHSGTTFLKRLIKTDENKGKIATYNYAWLEKGKQFETHSHPDGEEFFLFIESNGEMLVGENWSPVQKGDFVSVPIGANHSVKNTGDKDLVFITLRTVSS